jgi:hypothetical protein
MALPQGEAWVRSALAQIALEEGELLAAREGFADALAIQRELHYANDSEWSLCGLAGVSIDEGDLGQARRHLEEAAGSAFRRAGEAGVCRLLHHFAVLAVAEGRLETGARLCAAAESLPGQPWTESARDRRNFNRAVATVQARLGPDTLAAAWKAGGELQPDEVSSEVLGCSTDASLLAARS